jgi:hypothetical protein
MSLACEPPQPEPVAAAIESLIGDSRELDPWWAAGLEALRSWDGAASEQPWGGAGIVEP